MNPLVVSYQGFKVSVSRIGTQGVPIVFLHGLGSSQSIWNQAPKHLCHRTYQIITFDLPGFGESTEGAENFDYSMQSLAECTAHVARELGLSDAHVVAHSMGGVIALLLAEMSQLRFRSLCLAEGNLIESDAFMSGKIARLPEARFVKSYALWLSSVSAFMAADAEEERAQYMESLRKANPTAMHRAAKSCAALTQSGTLQEKFERLRCPKAYIFGERTKLSRPLPSAALSSLVTHFEVKGQGHFMMQDSAGFYGPLGQWLAMVQSQTGAPE